ncbi:MAG: hypothetical protein J3R72DRAFT_488728 [Linnemannia gamsii]|nr:MAG: hypothetical protein J3R72DRAFT_488728 [Linnemannia gamsii]
MPMVTSVAFLAKNTLFQSSGLIKSAIKEHVVLKMIEVVYLPDGGVDRGKFKVHGAGDFAQAEHSSSTDLWPWSYLSHIGDLDISKVFQYSSVTRLMLVGQHVELDCKPQDILSFIQVVQLARTQSPALTKLHLWNVSHDAMEDFGVSSSRTLITYDLIHQKMDFGDYFVSQEEISNLRRVFRGNPLLSEMKMTVPTHAVNNSFLVEGEREDDIDIHQHYIRECICFLVFLRKM